MNNNKLHKLPGRTTTQQLRSRAKSYEDDTAGVEIISTPSATGKGIHKRWKYMDSSPNIRNTEKKAAVRRPLRREMMIHIDNVFTAPEQLPPAGSTVKSSTPLVENVAGSPVKSKDDDNAMHVTPGERSCDQDIPLRIVLNPEDLGPAAVMRRMMEQEQRIEDTFQVQLQKMVDRRLDALRLIKTWEQESKDNEGKDGDSVRGRTITRDSRSQSTGVKRRRKRSKKEKPRGRPLGPCGTIIIDMDDEYKNGLSTSAPPVYPPEWVAKQLAGRESTEELI